MKSDSKPLLKKPEIINYSDTTDSYFHFSLIFGAPSILIALLVFIDTKEYESPMSLWILINSSMFLWVLVLYMVNIYIKSTYLILLALASNGFLMTWDLIGVWIILENPSYYDDYFTIWVLFIALIGTGILLQILLLGSFIIVSYLSIISGFSFNQSYKSTKRYDC